MDTALGVVRGPVGVRAADHHAGQLAGYPAGEPRRERDGRGGFGRHPELFPQQVASGEQFGVADQHRPHGAALEDREGQLADPGGAERGGCHGAHRAVDRPVRRERVGQALAVVRLDRDRGARADRERGAGGQAAAADRDGHRVDLGCVGDDLRGDRTLAGDHRGIVVGGQVPVTRLVGYLRRGGRRFGVRRAVTDQPNAGRFDAPSLAGRDRGGDEHRGRQAEQGSGGGHAQAVVAARRRDHVLHAGAGEHRVQRTTQLERAAALQVFKLEHQPAAVDLGLEQRCPAHVRTNRPRRCGHVGGGEGLGRCGHALMVDSPGLKRQRRLVRCR